MFLTKNCVYTDTTTTTTTMCTYREDPATARIKGKLQFCVLCMHRICSCSCSVYHVLQCICSICTRPEYACCVRVCSFTNLCSMCINQYTSYVCIFRSVHVVYVHSLCICVCACSYVDHPHLRSHFNISRLHTSSSLSYLPSLSLVIL